MEFTLSFHDRDLPACSLIKAAFRAQPDEWEVAREEGREERSFQPVAKALGFNLRSKKGRRKAAQFFLVALVALRELIKMGWSVTVNISSYEERGVTNMIKIENSSNVTIIHGGDVIFQKDSCTLEDLKKGLLDAEK